MRFTQEVDRRQLQGVVTDVALGCLEDLGSATHTVHCFKQSHSQVLSHIHCFKQSHSQVLSHIHCFKQSHSQVLSHIHYQVLSHIHCFKRSHRQVLSHINCFNHSHSQVLSHSSLLQLQFTHQTVAHTKIGLQNFDSQALSHIHNSRIPPDRSAEFLQSGSLTPWQIICSNKKSQPSRSLPPHKVHRLYPTRQDSFQTSTTRLSQVFADYCASRTHSLL